MNLEEFYGRLVTWPKARECPEGTVAMPSLLKGRCGRCGGRTRATLPGKQSYCLDCLTIGRVSTLDKLLTVPEPNDFETVGTMHWNGQLTAKQEKISCQLIKNYSEGVDQLLWAVTGAGKTEILFPLIGQSLKRGLRVGFVSPRVDVVLELAPRIQAAFSVSLQVLYGEQEEPYRYSQLVLGTVHQLLRFYQAFDLLIIDEVDAFPYRGNRLLERAVRRSVKSSGHLVMLTATPSKRLLDKVKERGGRLLMLPERFHGQHLPEITLHVHANWEKRFSRRLKQLLLGFERQELPFIIFVPKVRHLIPVFRHVTAMVPSNGTTVHANDPDRLKKVADMRAGHYRYLVSTTILERGVTLPKLQVVILGADDPTFTKEALLQMAGRVGRSRVATEGVVFAVASGPARTIRAAQKEIRLLNEKAGMD